MDNVKRAKDKVAAVLYAFSHHKDERWYEPLSGGQVCEVSVLNGYLRGWVGEFGEFEIALYRHGKPLYILMSGRCEDPMNEVNGLYAETPHVKKREVNTLD